MGRHSTQNPQNSQNTTGFLSAGSAGSALIVVLGARPSNGERAPSRRATRAVILDLWPFFAGEAGLLGACSCFSDTLLGDLDDAAVFERDRSTADAANQLTVVRGDDDGCAACVDLAEQVHD